MCLTDTLGEGREGSFKGHKRMLGSLLLQNNFTVLRLKFSFIFKELILEHGEVMNDHFPRPPQKPLK